MWKKVFFSLLAAALLLPGSLACAAPEQTAEVRFCLEPADAALVITQEGQTLQPDEEGIYHLPTGEYAYRVSCDGFVDEAGGLRVSSTEPAQIPLTLTPGENTAPKAVNTEEIRQLVYDFLTNTLQLNTAGACGVMANIQCESGFDPTATWIDTNGLRSYGLCQWNGGRFQALVAFFPESFHTAATQLAYLKQELETTESQALQMLRGLENTADGAYMAGSRWAQYFERCARFFNGIDQYDRRGCLAAQSYWPVWYHPETPAAQYLARCESYPACLGVAITVQTQLRSLPCSQAADGNSAAGPVLSAGERLTASAIHRNTEGTLWYEVTRSGETWFVYAGHTSAASWMLDDISVTETAVPASLTVGRSFGIRGEIYTARHILTRVTGYVSPGYGNTGRQTITLQASAEPMQKSFSLKGSQVDNGLTFGKLPTGQYTYYIFAEMRSYYSTDGTTLRHIDIGKVVLSSNFDVIPDGITLPVSLTAIDAGAFAGIRAKKILIPAGVQSIGSRAFAGCTGLEILEFAGSPRTIADDMLAGCGAVTIRCAPGSTAESWALAHGLTVQYC